MNFKDFRIDNKLKESKYYKDNDEVSLNVRTWIGLKEEYKSKLNYTDEYYENIDLKFKWQKGLSVASLIVGIFFNKQSFINHKMQFSCFRIYKCFYFSFYFSFKKKKSV